MDPPRDRAEGERGEGPGGGTGADGSGDAAEPGTFEAGDGSDPAKAPTGDPAEASAEDSTDESAEDPADERAEDPPDESADDPANTEAPDPDDDRPRDARDEPEGTDGPGTPDGEDEPAAAPAEEAPAGTAAEETDEPTAPPASPPDPPAAEPGGAAGSDAARDLTGIQPGMIGLVEVPADAYVASVTDIVAALMEDGSQGIVVNVSRPYETLIDVFEAEGIDVKRLCFIDCISRLVRAETEETDRTLFLESPTMLELVAMGVDHFLPEAGEGGFVIFESYGSLVTYNNFELVYEFTNFLVNKLRLRRMRGFLVVVSDQLPDNARSSLAQLTDAIVRWEAPA